MIETPQIASTPAQSIAVIRLTVPCADMPKVMGPGISELMATVAAQGIAITGPWFTHHLRMPSDSFEFEIGVPVDKPVQAAGRVVPGQRPSMTVASTVLHGNYDGLASAWGEFGAWIESQGHQPAADFWEIYTKGPESSADPAHWRTQLSRPLTDARP